MKLHNIRTSRFWPLQVWTDTNGQRWTVVRAHLRSTAALESEDGNGVQTLPDVSCIDGFSLHYCPIMHMASIASDMTVAEIAKAIGHPTSYVKRHCSAYGIKTKSGLLRHPPELIEQAGKLVKTMSVKQAADELGVTYNQIRAIMHNHGFVTGSRPVATESLLSESDISIIAQLAEEGIPIIEIAHKMEVSASHIERVLRSQVRKFRGHDISIGPGSEPLANQLKAAGLTIDGVGEIQQSINAINMLEAKGLLTAKPARAARSKLMTIISKRAKGL